ncbi:RNA polymerase II transcription elongation factor-domain-containing protein [Podospora australis]|uniref:RNA polymerase II transcription elongation factor-domain-containing protein n=1 Tax=Podospora australis TaxID=1536484 RepID=A0AAN6WX26_9PEZI|nr:RNA polymerase II transcription elongation factor-domain-containing protein [Podospora australis]
MAAIDPTKAGKYPVILSPELLGKPSKETYTGIRYNHKPTLSSDTAPSTARLKKLAPGGTFSLGFDDNGGRYAYKGVRTTEDGKYVLIFDPKRQAFVLHRVDSMFHMNLVRTPTENVETLRKKFPQLEVKSDGSASSSKSSSQTTATQKGTAPAAPADDKPGAKNAKKPVAPKPNSKAPTQRQAAPLKAPVRAAKGKGKAAADKKAPVSITLPDPKAKPKVALPMPTLPTKKAPEPEKKPKKRTDSDEEDSEEDDDDDDDDDFGLTIEYPDANIRPHVETRSLPASLERRFSEADFGSHGGGGGSEELDFSAFERERDGQNAMDTDDEDEDVTFEDVVNDDVRLMPPPPRPLPRAPASWSQVTDNPPVIEPEVYVFDAGLSSDEDREGEVEEGGDGEAETGDDDFDLEAELVAAFEEVEEGAGDDPGGNGGNSDSEVSEEE